MSVPVPASVPSTVFGISYPVVEHALAIVKYIEGNFGSLSSHSSLKSLFLDALIAELQSLKASA